MVTKLNYQEQKFYNIICKNNHVTGVRVRRNYFLIGVKNKGSFFYQVFIFDRINDKPTLKAFKLC